MAGYPLKRIGIDARMYGLEHAGIGRYVMNLVDRVIKNPLKVEWVVIVHPGYQNRFKGLPNVKVEVSSIRHYSLQEQTYFLQYLNSLHLDLLHVPHFNVPLFYNRPFVTTIHDILWHKVKGGNVTTLPPWLYHIKHIGYRSTVKHAVVNAQAVITPSKYVKADLMRTFPAVPAGKIHVIYEGASSLPKSANSAQLLTNDPYLIYIGSAYPHKNLPVLFDALAILKTQGLDKLKLVLVSSRSVFLDAVSREVMARHLAENVIFAGYQTDAAVSDLMHHAAALVHPSKSEGFGLTGIEAMAAGVPVIAANAAALPEIYADAALFFDPDNAGELADAITRLTANRTLRDDLIHKGKARALAFSWDCMVKQTLSIYEKVLG